MKGVCGVSMWPVRNRHVHLFVPPPIWKWEKDLTLYVVEGELFMEKIQMIAIGYTEEQGSLYTLDVEELTCLLEVIKKCGV